MKKYLLTLATFFALAISSNAQLVNPGFETWTKNQYTSSTAYDPNSGLGSSGWWDFNILNSALAGTSPLSVFPDSVTVHSNKYSAKITTVILSSTSYGYVKAYGVPDTMGMIITGNINAGISGISVKIGIPFSQRISLLQFYYQYAPNGVDTAYCAVSLSHFSGGKHNVLGGGIFETPAAASAWTQGTVNIFYDSTSGNPDTITVVFSSSGRSKAKPGSTLWIDDASVVTGVNELNAPPAKVNVYPDPATSQVNIAVTSTGMATRADIYNITGQKVNSYFMKNNFTAINTQSYSTGLYFYQVYDKAGSLMKTGKFSVVR